MPSDITFLGAFLVGLFGGVHCVGMCGGIVAALTLGVAEQDRSRLRKIVPYLLAYNAGRIGSYTAAGALLGGVGALAGRLLSVHHLQLVLLAVAGLFMVAMGLYLAGWWHGLTRLEHLGTPVWRGIQPLGRKLFPVSGPRRAFQLGLVWGWLPCGLVYSVLIWSIAAGSTRDGALLMLSFGLGTLPTLFGMGAAASAISRAMQSARMRSVAGLLVGGFGIYALSRAVLGLMAGF